MRSLRWSTLSSLFVALLSNSFASEGAESLSEIRAAYVGHVAKLKSVSVEFTVRQSLSLPGSRGSGDTNDIRKRWIRQDKQWLDTMEPVRYPGSERAVAKYHSFDGAHAWQVSFTGDDAKTVREVLKCHGFLPWKQRQTPEPERLLGTSINGAETSLAELFDLPESELAGWEVIDGADCARIAFEPHRLHDGAISYRVVAWFDRGASFLPRRIDVHVKVDKPDVVEAPLGPEITETILISKFLECSSGAATKLAYPERATIMTPVSQREIVIDHVEIDPRLPADSFVPNIPPGTTLVERFQDGRRRRSVAGSGPNAVAGRIKLDAEKAHRIAASAAESLHSPKPISAAPPQNRIAWFLGIASLAAIVGAVTWRRMMR